MSTVGRRRSLAVWISALVTLPLLSVLPTTAPASALDNGLAQRPPMGWNSWNDVRCYELTEDVVRDAADALVETGMRDTGYEYVVVDDCWQAHTRGPDGKLRAHPDRFPSGMKALADYVHARGLKFGIYSSPGTATCAMYWDDYPGVGLGSYGHEQQDAETFASWEVDYLKYDWCRADVNDGLEPVPAFSTMRDALDSVDRDIVYSISEYGDHEPWTWAHSVANLWRTTADLQPNWSSVSRVIDGQASLADHTGRPGAWNDPDMLQVGNGSLTEVEDRAHFSLWAILNAPLFAGTDVTALSDATRRTLTNREVIAINQDFAGTQGRRLVDDGDLEVWGKPLSDGGYAVVLYNISDRQRVVRTDLSTLGLDARPHGWTVRDLWAHQNLGRTTDVVSAAVPGHGVAMLRLTPAARAAGALPLLEGGLDQPIVEAGTTSRIKLTIENDGPVPLREPEVSVPAPAGFDIEVGEVRPQVLPPHGRLTIPVVISAPDDATGHEVLRFAVSGDAPAHGSGRQTVPVEIQVVPPAPTTDTALSALPFITSTNGWGPVERDQSNGESAAGDGRALSVGGSVYTNGLGTHAAAGVTIHTGGNCGRFSAVAGVDDEVGDRGSVRFEVRGDSRTLFSSATITGAQGGTPIDVDISGTTVLELLVHDGGDGIAFDHADWADAAVRCSDGAPAAGR